MAGMKVNVQGMLRNMSRGSKPSYMAMEFINHLKMLKNDPKLHGEFFDLYVFSEPKEERPSVGAAGNCPAEDGTPNTDLTQNSEVK